MRIPKIPTLKDLDVRGKKVLLRVDINCPIDPKTGKIIDDSRIRAHAETVKLLIEEYGTSLVIISHQGRPGGPDFISLEEHVKLLSKYSGIDVGFIDDVIGPAARERIKKLGKGEALLLDNLRLVSEELIEALPEKQVRTYLVKRLAPLFDIFINDAFATAHRSQPSIVGFPLVMPSVAGPIMEREVSALKKAFEGGESPKVFVLGGAKVHDTLRIIEYLVRNKIADRILTTGLIAELFLVAKAVNIGKENLKFLEEKGLLSLIPRARRILLQGAPIETPIDFKTVINGDVREEVVGNVKGLIRDLGPNTISMYAELMREAKIIVIRGPAGVIEDPRFKEGTERLVDAALSSGAYTIFGGGHLTVIVERSKLKENVGHLSTGGGALLIFLSGEPLPALEALHLSAKKFLGW